MFTLYSYCCQKLLYADFANKIYPNTLLKRITARTYAQKNYSENINGLTKLVVKYIPYRGISLSNPYRNHQVHSQLIC